ncbi:hypothetical protein C4J89_1054 [Pseudomonas sp. R4-35-07]|nr:hypothetical protein C4J89_1054 [Pseudomonas sp. R4-35-07]
MHAVIVGGGLPPMAVGQLPINWLIHRYREQAPSHICPSWAQDV